MNSYQWLYFFIELSGVAVLGWILFKFSFNIFCSIEKFIIEYQERSKNKDWEEMTTFFISGALEKFLSFCLWMAVFFIFPVAFLLFKEFVKQVIYGKVSFSKFIAYVPEGTASVANAYSFALGQLQEFIYRMFA